MAARFEVRIVGRSRCDWANEAVADYTRRLRRYGGIDERAVRGEPFRGDESTVREAEASRLLANLPRHHVLVALDERGERLDSHAFAALVDEARQQGTVVFCLGGPYGHGEGLRKAATHTVRLSDLVLNHEVARVVLYEQVYRALTLLEGAPYHH